MAHAEEVNQEEGFFSSFLKKIQGDEPEDKEPWLHLDPKKEAEVETRLHEIPFFREFEEEQEKRHGKPPTKKQMKKLKGGVQAFSGEVGLETDEVDDFLTDFLAKAEESKAKEEPISPILNATAPIRIEKPKNNRSILIDWEFPVDSSPAMTKMFLADWDKTMELRKNAEKKMSFIELKDLFEIILPVLEPLVKEGVISMETIIRDKDILFEKYAYRMSIEMMPKIVPLIAEGKVSWDDFVASVPGLAGKDYRDSLMNTRLAKILPLVKKGIVQWRQIKGLLELFENTAQEDMFCKAAERMEGSAETIKGIITLAMMHKGFRDQLDMLQRVLPMYKNAIPIEEILKMEDTRERKYLDRLGYLITGLGELIGKEISWEQVKESLPRMPAEPGSLTIFSGNPDLTKTLLGFMTLDEMIKETSVMKLTEEQIVIARTIMTRLGRGIRTKDIWNNVKDKIISVVKKLDAWTVEKYFRQIDYVWSLPGMDIKKVLEMLDKPGGLEIWILSKDLFKSNKIRSAQDLENAIDLFTTKEFSIKGFEEMVPFFNLVAARPGDMKDACKHFLADMMSRESYERLIELEVVEDALKKSFNRVLHAKGQDREMKFIIRQIATFLPLGPKGHLAIQVRHDALELQNISQFLLAGIKNKIHSYPGKEDVLIVKAYLRFLESGSIHDLRETWEKYIKGYTPKKEYAKIEAYKLKLDIDKIASEHDFLRDKTLGITRILLRGLEELWSFEASALRHKCRTLASSLDKLDMGRRYRSILKRLVKDMVRLSEHVDEGRKEEAAKMIGDMRMDCHTVMRDAPEGLKMELYFFEIFLDSLEQHIHPDIMRDLKIETWSDIEHVIDLVIQKTYSLMTTNHSDVAMPEAQRHLEDFKRSKDIDDLMEAIEYYNYAINYINDEVTKEFKDIFRQRLRADRKELEDLISPFYRTGAIFQLDQLTKYLQDNQNKIESILARIPKPLNTTMRDRLYARFGL